MAHIEDFDPQKHITQERATEIVDAYERSKNLNPYGYWLSPSHQRSLDESFEHLEATYKAEGTPEDVWLRTRRRSPEGLDDNTAWRDALETREGHTWISAQVQNPRLRIILNDLHNTFWELIDREDAEDNNLGLKKNIQLIQQAFINTVNKGWHKGLWSQQERDEAINWGGQEAREFIESIKNIRHPQDQPHYY